MVKIMLHIPINVAVIYMCLIFFYYSILLEMLTELHRLLILHLMHINTRTDHDCVARMQKLQSLDHLPDTFSERLSKLYNI